MIHHYPDEIFLLPWRGGFLAYRPWSGWARLLERQQVRGWLPASADPVPGETWQRVPPYRPECLTVLLQLPCNLACSYCYGGADPAPAPDEGELQMEAILEAARVVAENAHRRHRPMVLGFHGACEPLLALGTIKRCAREIGQLARRRGLTLELQTTTNGMAGPEALDWAGRQLRGLTLSWDGCQAVHDAQRPRRDGSGSHAAVMQSLTTLLRHPLQIRLRSTVTRRSCDTLERDVLELARGLQRGVVFQPEPAFGAVPGAGYGEQAPDPEDFCRACLRLAAALQPTHSRLELAGSRLDRLHGRHCAIWQRNLAVRADGQAVACFLPAAWERSLVELPDRTAPRLQRLRACTGDDLLPCPRCFARDHCARHCPHHCPLMGSQRQPDARLCRLVRRVLFAQLLERAGQPPRCDDVRDDVPEIMACVDHGPDLRLGVSEDDLPPLA